MHRHIISVALVLLNFNLLYSQGLQTYIGIGIGATINSSSIILDPNNSLREISSYSNPQIGFNFSIININSSLVHSAGLNYTSISTGFGKSNSGAIKISSYDYMEYYYSIGRIFKLSNNFFTDISIGPNVLLERADDRSGDLMIVNSTLGHYGDAIQVGERPMHKFGVSGNLDLSYTYRKVIFSLYSKLYLWKNRKFVDRNIIYFETKDTIETLATTRAYVPYIGYGLKVSFKI